MNQALSFDQMPDNGLLRLPTVLSILPYGKSSFLAKVAAGELPKPIKLGARSVAWRVADIRRILVDLNAQGVASA